ncbi:SRPBCC family protein [soil metagenome]
MFKKIALVIIVLVAAVLAYAATQPDSFRVERSATIKAPPDRIFALINDFHNWGAWSPWEKMDPAMQKSHSGPPSGKGAVYEWEGNSKVGKGRMEIVEALPTSKIGVKLDFLKPFEAHNLAEYTLQPEGDSTKVTWSMTGPNPYVAKVIHLFMSMDKMVGNDFETGLANLKALAEKQPASGSIAR